MARKFSGHTDGDQIISTNNIGISGSTNRTFVAWVYLTSLTGNHTICNFGQASSGKRWTFATTNTGALRIELLGSGYTSSLVIPTNKWTFVACRLNGTTLGSNDLFLGSSKESATGGNTVNTTDSQLDIGYNSLVSNRTFSGIISNAIMYDVDLTDAEIDSLRLGASFDTIRAQNCRLFYDSETKANIILDKSGRNNHGIITGTKPAFGAPQIKQQIKRTLKRPWYTLLETAAAAVTDIIVSIKRLFQRPVLAARRFNETDQYGIMADHPDLTLPDGDWTMAIKFRLTDNTGSLFKYLLSNDAFGANNSLNIYLREASASTPNRLEAMFEDAGGDFYDDGIGAVRSSSSPGSRTYWQTWFFQRSGTTLTMYDGNTDVGNATNASVGAINSANDLHIGKRFSTPTDRWFGGDIEYIAKWDRALSSNERISIINGAPRSKFPTALKYDVAFDDSSQGIDLSGNHHDVTWVANPKPVLASPEAKKLVIANKFFGFGEATVAALKRVFSPGIIGG